MQVAVERTLRMRAPDFRSALVRAGASPSVELPNRARFRVGDRVRLEVSFGPMADEVDLFGIVAESKYDAEDGPQAAGAQLDLEEGCAAQLAYVLDVLGGQREAAARRHRRLASNLQVRWFTGDHQHATRLADISSGGAFILSRELPEVDDHVVVQFQAPGLATALRVDASVSWVRSQDDGRRGFGVSFRPQDASLAKRLVALVRDHEDADTGL